MVATDKSVAVEPLSFDPALVRADAAQYLMNTYKRPDIIFTHGKGCRLYDSDGREYLDFLAGIAVNGLGYAHPKIVRVIRRESARAIHISNLFHNPFQGPLARKLAEWSGLDRVFFCNSGTEAIEGALKIARAHAYKNAGSHSGKTRILALENSFHGRTFGALSITHTPKYREPFAPLLEGVEFVRGNDVADLEAKFNGSVCAIVIEPIQGEGGIFPISEEFWNRARQLATQHNAALIADEIQCGLGRTGRKFGYQKFTAVDAGSSALPDIVTLAKPLAGGLPLGAILANEKFAGALVPGMHGSTFGGGPLSCAVALEFLSILENEGVLENVSRRGAQLRKGLQKLKAKFDFIVGIRGKGLMIGIDLAHDGAPYVEHALRNGVIMNCTHGHILRLLPPFIIKTRDVTEFLERFEKILTETPRPQAAPDSQAAPAEPVQAAAQTAAR